MKREPVEIHARKPLTKRQRAQLALDQDGKCGCGCGNKLDAKAIDEHIIPLWCGGTNDLDNRKLYAFDCAKRKTAKEATERGRVKRLIAKESPETRKPPKMKSGGFRPKPEGFKTKWPKRKFGA